MKLKKGSLWKFEDRIVKVRDDDGVSPLVHCLRLAHDGRELREVWILRRLFVHDYRPTRIRPGRKVVP